MLSAIYPEGFSIVIFVKLRKINENMISPLVNTLVVVFEKLVYLQIATGCHCCPQAAGRFNEILTSSK